MGIRLVQIFIVKMDILKSVNCCVLFIKNPFHQEMGLGRRVCSCMLNHSDYKLHAKVWFISSRGESMFSFVN